MPGDLIEDFRAKIGAMTPGTLAQHSHHVVVWGQDGGNVASCGDPRGSTTAGAYTDPGFTDGLEEAYANAAGIVASVAVCRRLTDPATVEEMARMIYALDPIYDSGECIDGFQVTPGGELSWEQFSDQCAEFGDDRLFHGWNDKREAILTLARSLIAYLIGGQDV